MKTDFKIEKGDFLSFGTKKIPKGMNFTFCKTGEEAKILFFDAESKKAVTDVLVPKEYMRGNVCSVNVYGPDFSKLCYLYEFDGEKANDPYCGVVYGRETYNLDKTVNNRVYSGFFTEKPGKSMEDDKEDFIIYKAHLRGISMDRKIKEESKGTYKGLLTLIPKLKEMGINAIELFPIYEFDEKSKDGKINYWGYGDILPFYFAPKSSYFGGKDVCKNALNLIKAFHEAGIYVFMEMCFPENLSQDFIIEVIKSWTFNYGVDGFSFIGKGVNPYNLIYNPFLKDVYMFFEDISFDLKEICGKEKKRIFIKNHSFMYALRRILNHMDGSVAELADMIRRQKETNGYVNYVAASNGFTLYDSFSYSDKHNEKNGENNQDGDNYNCTVNCGVEGPTKDKSVNALRLKKIRTSLAILLFSQGVPFICAGDEMLNSQEGNNNPYCQDNKTGWVNYSKKKDANALLQYIKKLMAFRKSHPILLGKTPLTFSDYKNLGTPDMSYHGKEPWVYELCESHKSLGILFNGAYGYEDEKKAKNAEDVMVLLNFYNNKESFNLPKIPGKKWYFLTNTSDFVWNEEGLLYKDSQITVPEGSLSLLVAK